MIRRSSVVVVVVRRQSSSILSNLNIFEAIWLVLIKFYVQHYWDGVKAAQGSPSSSSSFYCRLFAVVKVILTPFFINYQIS